MNLIRLDHIAMACADLGTARSDLETRLGVPMASRGEHADMGTHNHLLSLGPEIYFELIAINPEAKRPNRPRWFDLDNFDGETRLTNWIVATDDMQQALKVLPDGMGTPLHLQRAEFRWQMAVPETGLLPFDGWAPAVIEWDGPAHPAPQLEDHGVRLQSLALHHPHAAEMAEIFAPHLPRDTILFMTSETPWMEALLTTPNGDVRLT